MRKTEDLSYYLIERVKKMHFAFNVGHRCVCERPLGTGKRPPQIEGF